MAAIPSGITYESLEDQALGAVQHLLAAQADPAKNPAPAKTLVSNATFNAATNVFSATLSIPCVASVGTDGNIRVDAAESFL